MKQRQTFNNLAELKNHVEKYNPHFFEKSTLIFFGSVQKTVGKDWVITLANGEKVEVVEYKEKRKKSLTPNLWSYDYFDLKTGKRYMVGDIIKIDKIYI